MNRLAQSLRAKSDIKIISKTTLLEGEHIRVVLYEYTKGDNPKIHKYEAVERVKVEKIVSALTVTEDQKVILINQYRIPQGRFCIESPAGLQDKEDETLEDTARREILEETGYVPEELVYVGRTPTSSGLTSEIVDCYIGLNCRRVSEILALDNAEDIQVLEIPLSKMDDFLEEIKLHEEVTVDSKIGFMLNEYRILISKQLGNE